MKKKFKLLFKVNWLKTLYFNLNYFEPKVALKFPVLFYGKIIFHSLKGVVILDDIKNIKTGMIQFGNLGVGIFGNNMETVLNIHGNLIFTGTAQLGKGSSISIGPNSTLSIGNNFLITAKSSIIASGGRNVTFGNNCLLSWDVLVMNSDFHEILEDGHVINSPKDIIIGSKVWLGTKSTLLKGSVIPNNSIIGSGTLINKPLAEPNCIYAGMPARIVKLGIHWEK